MQAEFFKKAQDNLNLAKYCLEQGGYDASANRAYYAAFQAAIAALAHVGIINKKNDHKWVQATFVGELINRRKVYPSRLKSYLSDMLSLRNNADYSEKSVSQKLASRQLAKANEFVETIVKELKL